MVVISAHQVKLRKGVAKSQLKLNFSLTVSRLTRLTVPADFNFPQYLCKFLRTLPSFSQTEFKTLDARDINW